MYTIRFYELLHHYKKPSSITYLPNVYIDIIHIKQTKCLIDKETDRNFCITSNYPKK